MRAVELAKTTLNNVSSGKELLIGNVTVALIVADLQMDCETVCAAVLRGVMGQDGCESHVIEREVGIDVMRILKFHEEVERCVALCVGDSFTEMSFSNLRELILAGASKEQRAINLELARAVLQIRTVERLQNEEHRREVARRTMYLYAPLANQMGMWFVQGELEELAFMYMDPTSYNEVRRLVGERRRECESTLAKSKTFVEQMLSSSPEVRSKVRTVLIKGRVKGLHSVHRKMKRSGKKVHEIYDLLALRVIIQPKKADEASEAAACYAVAEAIKSHYDTFESRAKDYIACPKRNGYRSIHMTVVPQGGYTPLEIQIRTEKMHHVAEFGAAAHWLYKESMDSEDEDTNDSDEEDGNCDSTTSKTRSSPAAEIEEGRAALEENSRNESCSESGADAIRAGMVVTQQARKGREEEMLKELRKGYVSCLGSAIRASRVIVATAGQVYGLAVGSTLLDLARGLGVASLGVIAVVNGSVVPLTQRLEMNDVVAFL